jgi:hypothetical protein
MAIFGVGTVHRRKESMGDIDLHCIQKIYCTITKSYEAVNFQIIWISRFVLLITNATHQRFCLCLHTLKKDLFGQ